MRISTIYLRKILHVSLGDDHSTTPAYCIYLPLNSDVHVQLRINVHICLRFSGS